jgi:hypothetical protein
MVPVVNYFTLIVSDGDGPRRVAGMPAKLAHSPRS